MPIVAGALDRQLNEVGFILPGLGDFGDRLARDLLIPRARSPPSYALPAAAGGLTFPTNPASTTIVTMYGVMRTNSGGISRMIGASASRYGIACAKPKIIAATIRRFGFQLDRISAASAMNPRPCVWPSFQLRFTSTARNAPANPASAPESITPW